MLEKLLTPDAIGLCVCLNEVVTDEDNFNKLIHSCDSEVQSLVDLLQAVCLQITYMYAIDTDLNHSVWILLWNWETGLHLSRH
jgi:hypothetical protein